MRKLMWFTIGFGAVCALFAYWEISLWKMPLTAIFFLLTLGCWAAARLRRDVLRGALLFFGCFAAMLWCAGFQEYYLRAAQDADGSTMSISVEAIGYSYQTDYGGAVDGRTEIGGSTYQIRLYYNDYQKICPGQRISGEFLLRYTPGGEQEAQDHSGRRIFLLGYQRGTVETAQGEEKWYPALLAEGVKARLRQLFPEDVFPFTQALLLGDSSELDYETLTNFKVSGIRHIIAVSGLHVMLLYSLLSAAVFRKRGFTAVVCIPALFLFAAVAGFTPSVTRACIMASLMALAQMFDREYDPPTALSFAALAMLAVNPLAVTSVSFQLSVGCVAGIQLFQAPIQGWLSQKWKPKGRLAGHFWRWVTSTVSVTISAMSLITPLSAWYFGAVSLIGVVTNLAALWVVNLIFNSLVLALLVSLISMAAAGGLAWGIAWLIRYVLTVSDFLAGLPMAAVYTQSPYIVAWLVFVYLLLGVFLLSRKRRPGILISCGVLGLCMALLASWAEPLTDNCRVTVLDVGQGQSILLQSQGKTYLVDCGGDSDAGAADLAAETLLAQGISRLDGIILTHGDADHAGAVANLLTRLDADVIFLPATVEETAAMEITGGAKETIFVSQNLELKFGSAEITIFAPPFLESDNENSLCVLFEPPECAILITGDRSRLGEMALLGQGALPEVDVLIAGHHGSKYSTSQELLDAVCPDVVIISVGADNAYGHPAPEVLSRLEAQGCLVYRTDEMGTILFRR